MKAQLILACVALCISLGQCQYKVAQSPFGHDYFEGPFDATFDEAQVYCKSQGGNLAEPTSQTEVDWLVNTFRNKRWFRIGSSNKNNPNTHQYQWLNGAATTVTKWGPGQPWYNGQCMSLLIRFDTGDWGTDSCYVKSRFLCQKPGVDLHKLQEQVNNLNTEVNNLKTTVTNQQNEINTLKARVDKCPCANTP